MESKKKKEKLSCEECDACGVCCSLFYINLDEEEYNSKRYKTMFDFERFDFKDAEEIGANFLERKNGRCIYLKNNKCSIHHFRPKVCRKFFCRSKNPKYKKMIELINKEKKKIKK